jgi:hypothetical protein
MFQLSFLLAPSSDLPVATTLPAVPWLSPPHQGHTSSQGMLRRRQRRLETGHGTPLVVATHRPPSTRPMAARMGPCRVPRGPPTEPEDGGGNAGVSWRGMSAWAPTTTPLLLLHVAFPSQIPLALQLCACAEPPAWVDPMLEELTALLVVSPPQEHQRLHACLLRWQPLRKWTHR